MTLELKGEVWAEDMNWNLLAFSYRFELDKIIQGRYPQEEEGGASKYTNI